MKHFIQHQDTKKSDITTLLPGTQILIQDILCTTYKTTSESDHTFVLRSVLVNRQGVVFWSFSMGIKPCEILFLSETMEGHGWTQLL